LHAREKRRHRAHIEARFLQGQEPESIGFALELARKTDLRGDCARLPDGGGSRSELGIARNDRQRHCRQHRRGKLSFLVDHAREVALGDVRDFVRQHRGQFRFALRGGN